MCDNRGRSFRRFSKGFTLVELMLAFVILSFGIVFVLRSFGTALTALRKVDDVKTLSWLMEPQMDQMIRRSWEEMGASEGMVAGDLTAEDGKVYPWRLAVVPNSLYPTLNEAILILSKGSGRPASLMSSTYLLKREGDEKKQ
ncbi:MAG: type II secretion system protein [Candidatus Omnitrophota bacterium]